MTQSEKRMSTPPACTIGGPHVPEPLTGELHHAIPVAWQQFWRPAVAPFPGVDPDGRGMLWDARTVALCPTHHRNVHARIVQFMRAGISTVDAIGGVLASGAVAIPLRDLDRNLAAVSLVDAADAPRVVPYAWTLSQRKNVSYAKAAVGRRKAYMHRLLCAGPSGSVVHHRNGNGLDNRSANLESLTPAQHGHRAQPRATATRVHEHWPGRFRAYIQVGGKREHWGCFYDYELAAMAADSAYADALIRLADGPETFDLIEAAVAFWALERFVGVGGSLQSLIAAGEWGQI